MVFSSVSFLFCFLPVFLLLYFAVPRIAKNYVLLLASLIFYYVGVQSLVFVMLGCVLLNYTAALLIGRFRMKKRLLRSILILAILASFGILFYFKYVDFVIENVNALFGSSFDSLGVLLPIGISFYVFQTVSYTVDVYRGDILPQKNPFTLAMYITMFPQLVAGPIVRYRDIETSLYNRRVTVEKVGQGISRFVIGLAKKVILANTLAELCTNIHALDEKSVIAYWIGAIAFLFQIYFDFSGYSDMAIGLGRIMGFDFPENFRYPYIAKSVSEFFRRWHISLGTWFRDYVYIPLGGNRKGKWRLVLNLTVVWALTGLWHGAAWNFVVWGIFYAVLLVIEKLFFGKVLEKIPSAFGQVYTLLAALFGFVIFDASGMGEALTKLGGMFGARGIALSSPEAWYLLKSFALILLISAIAATPFVKRAVEKISKRRNGRVILTVAEPLAMLFLFLLSTAFLVDSSFNPFIYFRF